MSEPLRPVLLPADPTGRRGRELLAYLSARARVALFQAAAAAALPLGKLDKDANDAPLPDGDVHWSIAHKDRMVAGVADRAPLGIDVEEIRTPSRGRPRDEGLLDYIGTPAEWEVLGGRDWDRFYRLFTAKEAVLKRAGIGVAGLRQCRAAEVAGERLVLTYKGERILVDYFYHGDHVAAVTVAPERRVAWGVGA